MSRDKIITNDRQLACARIHSQEGQNYFKAMSAIQNSFLSIEAENFEWVNRSSMTFFDKTSISKMFSSRC